MATKAIKVPDIGDFDEVDVIEVLVSVGDTIEAEQSLITLESDKATMEVPASEGGKVTKVMVKVGDKVAEGAAIIEIEPADGAGAAEAPAQDEAPAEQPAPAAAPSASGGGGTQEVTVPDIGDFDEVDVIEVLVSAGDSVEAEQSLITLESDKATMEVPAPAAGTVKDVKIKVGDKVSEGSVILTLEAAGGAAPAASQEAPAKAEQTTEKPTEKPAEPARTQHHVHQVEADAAPVPAASIDSKGHKLAHASPSVRRYARELGVDLSRLQGSGRKGRILKEDVQAFVKGVMKQGGGAAAGAPATGGAGIPPIPPQDFSKFGEVEEQPMSRIKKISGPHLHRSWLNVPHVTQFDEADITELEAFRKAEKAAAEQEGVKLTPLAFLVKASARALRKFPDLNSSLNPAGDALIIKHYINVGVAVDTPNGLVVPVIKDADKKGIYEIAADLGVISKKARDGKLGPGDMQGGTFSISSLGGIGGTAFTPIVNAPEVAILGVSKSEMKPVWNGKEFVPRLMLPLSLSYDHRAIDGAAGARFTTYLCGLLSDLRRLVL
ncbi:pyruvate dehydrogenase E2 component (dihydrolipoamide acetyltransferase) [Natronocella acetinitrilica]|uniref:Acetyltransferase component of pyruvate dehydrogenase complex n=1 Tax=Natronocella acetinitrilica TaxID=414046 RepID=A0AAE3G1J9_9GAMM|nr:dihydrolipoyllysine-residue acetyltransferase [Natronocella acetinitrilica]MCP1673319.1 pyruvate dehydrogenase E2 component (dihydrolipoamide acetyltransferase) [Natronocella acetinitrilica]